MNQVIPFNWERFEQTPVVGILRGMPWEIIQPIAAIFQEAGLSTLEVTMNTGGATEILARLREVFPGINVGAGTVCNMEELKAAIQAGAQFIVTPIINGSVIKNAILEKVPVFPGAYTPTEIYRAWALGAAAVKVFPATQLGAPYIKDVLAPLEGIKLLPTGGVNAENIQSFFAAGAVGVGMGSSLFDKKLIEEKNFSGLKEHFIGLKTKVQAMISN